MHGRCRWLFWGVNFTYLFMGVWCVCGFSIAKRFGKPRISPMKRKINVLFPHLHIANLKIKFGHVHTIRAQTLNKTSYKPCVCVSILKYFHRLPNSIRKSTPFWKVEKICIVFFAPLNRFLIVRRNWFSCINKVTNITKSSDRIRSIWKMEFSLPIVQIW